MRRFEVVARISGAINNFDNCDGVTRFTMEGNKRSSNNSIINGVKRICSLCGCKIEEVISIKEL